LSAQTILNQCVDLPTINNQFCQLIFPRQAGGLLQSPALISAGVNFAQFAADGIDIEVSYRRTFDNGHRLNVRGIATYVTRRTNFTSPTDPAFGDRIKGELGDPSWAANLNISYGIGPFDLRYSMNYIGRQWVGAYENYNSFQGRPPQNADNALPNRYPDVLYHAARMSYRVNERFQFYGGVDNIFDTAPPLGLTGTAGGDPFDAIGRYFYAGATVDF
jgi:outer membrane receptor protein involved in Fe transport